MSHEEEKAGATQNGAGEEEEDVVKVILLGDSAVGKSKLIERFLMVSWLAWAAVLRRTRAQGCAKRAPWSGCVPRHRG